MKYDEVTCPKCNSPDWKYQDTVAWIDSDTVKVSGVCNICSSYFAVIAKFDIIAVELDEDP